MTRINSGIPVRQLTDEHLLAEHREISRLPSYLRRSISSGSIANIPPTFRLGKGHVLFFLDKGEYTLRRYKELHAESVRRGFNLNYRPMDWIDFMNHRMMADYSPTDEDTRLLTERITTSIMESPKPYFHFYRKRITKQEAVRLLQRT